MPHNVLVIQRTDADVFNVFDDLHRILQAAALAVRQVHLGNIAGDDRLGAEADTGEEHLHLLGGGILRFVQYNKCVVERAAAHVGEGGDFDGARLLVAAELFCRQKFCKAVVDGAQVGGYLFLEVAFVLTFFFKVNVIFIILGAIAVGVVQVLLERRTAA